MSNHTPGPWYWCGEALMQDDKKGMCSRDVLWVDNHGVTNEADKPVIAAAPEMLEALVRAEGEIQEYYDMAKPPVKGRLGKSLKMVQEAIKKAKGN